MEGEIWDKVKKNQDGHEQAVCTGYTKKIRVTKPKDVREFVMRSVCIKFGSGTIIASADSASFTSFAFDPKELITHVGTAYPSCAKSECGRIRIEEASLGQSEQGTDGRAYEGSTI